MSGPISGGGRSVSLAGALTLLGLGAAGVALALSFGGVLLAESLEARSQSLREAHLLADVVGRQSAAALLFLDPASANETLRSLAVDPDVELACLYDASDVLFARYSADASGTPRCPASAPAGEEVERGRAWVSRTLTEGGETIGTMHLVARVETLGGRLLRRLGVLLPVLLAAGAAAALFARRVQGRIAGPIGALAENAQALARGDLAVRPRAAGIRELDLLARSFERMTEQLRSLLARTREDADAVTGAVGRLSATSRELADRARAQEGAVIEAGGSLERIVASSEDVRAGAETLTAVEGETSEALGRLDESISIVDSQADSLSEGVEASASTVSELSKSIESVAEYAGSVENASRISVQAVAEMRAAVDLVRRHTSRSEELSAETLERARTGRAAVDRLCADMRQLDATCGDMRRTVLGLAEKSGAIGGIVEVIGDLARESAMLALNAAIIAARAGEHGKGFGVVAQHVSELAERTTASAGEIGELIRAVQEETDATARLVEGGVEHVRAGVERATNAGSLLHAIEQSAGESATMSSEIAQAAERQAADIRRVEEATTEVRAMIRHIARSIVEQRDASAGFAETMSSLRELAARLDALTDDQRRTGAEAAAAMERMRKRVTSIASAVAHQRNDGERIESTLATFRAGAESGRSVTATLEQVVADLAARAQELGTTVHRFRLDDG